MLITIKFQIHFRHVDSDQPTFQKNVDLDLRRLQTDVISTAFL